MVISYMFSSWSQGFKCHLHVDRFPIYIFSSDVLLELKNRKTNLPVDFTFPKTKYREMSMAERLKILTLSLLGSYVLTTPEHPTLTLALGNYSDYGTDVVPSTSVHSTDLILWVWNLYYTSFYKARN